MQQQLRYAKTADGVSIGYFALGQGRPFIQIPSIPFSHISLALQIPELRRLVERQSQTCQVIQYDNRGAGSSQRDVRDWSLNAHVRDLEAVAEALAPEPFVLWAGAFAGPVAIAYAARHPERVSHLILWCTWARAREMGRVSVLGSALAVSVLSRDWVTFTETGARQGMGWSEGDELAHRMAGIAREALSPKMARRALGFGGANRFDAVRYLSKLTVPTLVLHRREAPFPKEQVSRRLAARVPGARLQLLEGRSLVPLIGDRESVARAVNDFVGDQLLPPDEGVESALRVPALATVLFTDLVGHTEMMQRLGDEAGRDVLREHERITRDVLQEHGGVEVKTMGDGFMASFGSVTKAVECAISLQRAFDAWNHGEGQGGPDPRPLTPDPLLIRVGLNAGEPIAEEDDLFGSSVILAARIAAQAQGGQILASVAVRELAMGKGFLFSDRGETALRGFEDPVRLYEVRWRE